MSAARSGTTKAEGRLRWFQFRLGPFLFVAFYVALLCSLIATWRLQRHYEGTAYLQIALPPPPLGYWRWMHDDEGDAVLSFNKAAATTCWESFVETIDYQRVLRRVAQELKDQGFPELRNVECPGDWLSRRVTIDRPGDAEVLEIRATSRNAASAARITNALAEAYPSVLREVADSQNEQLFERARRGVDPALWPEFGVWWREYWTHVVRVRLVQPAVPPIPVKRSDYWLLAIGIGTWAATGAGGVGFCYWRRSRRAAKARRPAPESVRDSTS